MYIKTILLLTFLLQPGLILIDKIAAVVNGEVITVSDIEKAIGFYPILRNRSEADDVFYYRVLDELINSKIIYQEYRNEFALTDDDYEQVQSPILLKAGSMEKLRALLKSFDMEWNDFREYIREKVLYEKVIREKFPMNIIIQFKEIEDFYEKEYVPSQRQLNLAPRTLIEMAPIIEKYLRKSKTEERLAGWLADVRSSYKIENKMRSEK